MKELRNKKDTRQKTNSKVTEGSSSLSVITFKINGFNSQAENDRM